MPAIEDANAISISLDKKVKFAAIVVSSDLKGDYNGKTRVVKVILNFICYSLKTYYLAYGDL